LSVAIKMNYGIHGNVIPHLHLHLWPRFVDDPYDTGWPPEARSFVRTEEDLARMAAALRAAV
jgi:diadenosine tetraphosphate (Ap4A) HIT family hydrolase